MCAETLAGKMLLPSLFSSSTILIKLIGTLTNYNLLSSFWHLHFHFLVSCTFLLVVNILCIYTVYCMRVAQSSPPVTGQSP